MNDVVGTNMKKGTLSMQPKKRGVKRGTNRFVSASYTIADVFLDTLRAFLLL